MYHAVQGINEGLNHVDYEFVWKTMDRFCTENTEDGELVKRAYYHILCKNVKNCERHITEIIKQAGNPNHVIIEYMRRDQDKIEW